MTFEVLMMVLLSAAIHPFWNLLVKREQCPERTYFLLSVGSLSLALLHALIMGYDLSVPPHAWGPIALSVVGQLIYGFALVATYQKGDISIYYPIIRASPLFVIAASFLLFGKVYDWWVVLGIFIVLAGGAMLAIQPGKAVGLDGKTLMLAVLAMCGTGVYSMADGAATQLIESPVLFFYVQIIFAVIYGTVMRLTGKFHFSAMLLPVELPSIRRSLMASTLVYVSYLLILLAYAQGGDIALVTTVRQISIPLSVLMGGMMLKEKGMLPRFVASGVLSAGIVIALVN